MVNIEPIEQLRGNRTHALNAWANGSDMKDPNDSRFPRWADDDGRAYSMSDYTFWPQKVKDAEQTEFERLDAIYETEKAAL